MRDETTRDTKISSEMMKSLKEIAKLQQESAPYYFGDIEKDRMLKVIMQLTEDICVLKDRLLIMELLNSAGESISDSAIEDFQWTDQQNQQRLNDHQAEFEKAFSQLSGD